VAKLAERLAALEAEVAEIKGRLAAGGGERAGSADAGGT
jgi:hypothetical protein